MNFTGRRGTRWESFLPHLRRHFASERTRGDCANLSWQFPLTSKAVIPIITPLMAIGNEFYGVFSANNTPDAANFPNGVVFQRNQDVPSKTLFDVDGVSHADVSIDPFFFKVTP